MEKIYSRKRIRVPNIVYGKFNNNVNNEKYRKAIKVFTIFFIAILTAKLIINAISPMIDILCKEKAKEVATLVSNEKATKVMANYEYEDIMSVYKDSNDNITMIKANVITINKIISDIAVEIQNSLTEQENGKMYIRLGRIFWNKNISRKRAKNTNKNVNSWQCYDRL